MIERGAIAPFRVALLPTGNRDEWYSASAAYGRALTERILPALRGHVGVAGCPGRSRTSTCSPVALDRARDHYANAPPDVALTSLHYYFPWAIKTLLKWCAFCVVIGRRPKLDLDTRRYFSIADREDLDYGDKLAAYRRLADESFDSDRYHDFCASRLRHVDELVLDWFGSADFDRLLVDTVSSSYPSHEQERFTEHLRGLVGQWVREQGRHPAWGR